MFGPSLIGLHNCKAEAMGRAGTCGHRYDLNETHRRLKVPSRNVPWTTVDTNDRMNIRDTDAYLYSHYVSQAGFPSRMKTKQGRIKTATREKDVSRF